MGLVMIASRAGETTTTEGTGPITLDGSRPGCGTFASLLQSGTTTPYLISWLDGAGFEMGVGTYDTGILYRDRVIQTNFGVGMLGGTGNEVDLPAGVKKVDVVLPAYYAATCTPDWTWWGTGDGGSLTPAKAEGDRCVAIGVGSDAAQNNSVAVGYGSNTYHQHAVCVGDESYTYAPASFCWGNSDPRLNGRGDNCVYMLSDNMYSASGTFTKNFYAGWVATGEIVSGEADIVVYGTSTYYSAKVRFLAEGTTILASTTTVDLTTLSPAPTLTITVDGTVTSPTTYRHPVKIAIAYTGTAEIRIMCKATGVTGNP